MEKAKVKVWIAKDESNDVFMHFGEKPHREGDKWAADNPTYYKRRLPEEVKMPLKWEDEPLPYEMTIDIVHTPIDEQEGEKQC